MSYSTFLSVERFSLPLDSSFYKFSSSWLPEVLFQTQISLVHLLYFIKPINPFCIVHKSGDPVIYHLSGTLLRVKGGSSINYYAGATCINQGCAWQARTLVISHRKYLTAFPDPSCAFHLHTSALFCFPAGQANVLAFRAVQRAVSRTLQDKVRRPGLSASMHL